jgi:hypothetical protein
MRPPEPQHQILKPKAIRRGIRGSVCYKAVEMSETIDHLQAALQRALAGRPAVGGFPYPAVTLRRAGVTRNLWYPVVEVL